MAGCGVCNTKKSEGYYVISGDLIKDVAECTKKEAIAKKLEPFLQAVNGMINSDDVPPEEAEQAKKEEKPEKPEDKPGMKRGQKSWKILLHTQEPRLLGDFDKKVDDKLVKLIPDDSLFDEMFSRDFLQNENHVVYEITPRGGNHSTLEFHSKVSLNRGLSDPTHAQMHRFLSRVREISADDVRMTRTSQQPPDTFVNGSKLKMKAADSTSLVPFQECVSLQAKPSKEKHRRGGQDNLRIEYQAKWWWEEQHVGEFISAFTKLPRGGSIFLGVREEVNRGKQTGIFVPHGIILNDSERQELENWFLSKIKTDMAWFKEPSDHPKQGNPGQETTGRANEPQLSEQNPDRYVKIHFRNIQNGEQNECVVEVQVGHCPEPCFFTKEGPVSYQFRGNRMNKVGWKEWRELMEQAGPKTAAKRKMEDLPQAGPSTSKKQKN